MLRYSFPLGMRSKSTLQGGCVRYPMSIDTQLQMSVPLTCMTGLSEHRSEPFHRDRRFTRSGTCCVWCARMHMSVLTKTVTLFLGCISVSRSRSSFLKTPFRYRVAVTRLHSTSEQADTELRHLIRRIWMASLDGHPDESYSYQMVLLHRFIGHQRNTTSLAEVHGEPYRNQTSGHFGIR